MIDYVVIDEKLRKWVKDARVVRGIFDVSDHYLVVAEMQVEWKWIKKEVRKTEEAVDWQQLKKEDCRVKYVRELKKVE